MQCFPKPNPPSYAGVYSLEKCSTGELYVGCSLHMRRRRNYWRSALRTGQHITNPGLRLAAENTPLDGWEFNVLAKLPGASEAELRAKEREFIMLYFELYPGKLLNGA